MAVTPSDVSLNSNDAPAPKPYLKYRPEHEKFIQNVKGLGFTHPKALDDDGRINWAMDTFGSNMGKFEKLESSGRLAHYMEEQGNANRPFDSNSITDTALPVGMGLAGAYSLKSIPSVLKSGNSFNWKLGVPEVAKSIGGDLVRAGRQTAVANAAADALLASSSRAGSSLITNPASANAFKSLAYKAGSNSVKALGNVIGAASHAIPIYDAYRAGDAMYHEFNDGVRGQYNGGGFWGKTGGVLEAGANALTLGGYDATKSAITSSKNGQGGYGDVYGVEKDPYGAGKLGEHLGEILFQGPQRYNNKNPHQTNFTNYTNLGHP